MIYTRGFERGVGRSEWQCKALWLAISPLHCASSLCPRPFLLINKSSHIPSAAIFASSTGPIVAEIAFVNFQIIDSSLQFCLVDQSTGAGNFTMTADIIQRRISSSTQLSYLTNASSSVSSFKRLSIFIHGWGCQATHFSPLISHLTAKREDADNDDLYLAPDLPGHGKTPAFALPEPENGGVADLILKLVSEVIHERQNQEEKQISIVLYGHSMGTLTVLELFTAFQDSIMKVSHLVLLDGAWTGEQAIEPLNYDDLEHRATIYRESIQERLGLYFGPKTAPEFEAETRAGFAALDFEYALRMGHWYREVEANIAQSLQNLNAGNLTLVDTGEKPTRVLIVQSQEPLGPDGRRSLVKGQTTAHMSFVGSHLSSAWRQELVIEGTSHYPHVDNVHELVFCLDEFLRQ
jgi:pimeloyl-ACP methyl ester carboxylesterase